MPGATPWIVSAFHSLADSRTRGKPIMAETREVRGVATPNFFANAENCA
jgi:hypothetical protein